MSDQQTIPVGLCHCGCGEKTKPVTYDMPDLGYVRGEHFRYLAGHHMREVVAEGTHYIKRPDGCWEWIRARSRDGYGNLRRGKHGTAHRVFYEEKHGPIPEGLQLDHLCRNRACVNPDHLEAVPPAVNSRRGASTKLTWDEVRAIRRSTLGHAALGRRYGVTPQNIFRIRKGLTWKEAAYGAE